MVGMNAGGGEGETGMVTGFHRPEVSKVKMENSSLKCSYFSKLGDEYFHFSRIVVVK